MSQHLEGLKNVQKKHRRASHALVPRVGPADDDAREAAVLQVRDVRRRDEHVAGHLRAGDRRLDLAAGPV